MLAGYGFTTHRLRDDWNGADFLSQHINGVTMLRVQLKSRLTFQKKYLGKDLYVTFRDRDTWYLYPHDELLQQFLTQTSIGQTESWSVDGEYYFPTALSPLAKDLRAPFRL